MSDNPSAFPREDYQADDAPGQRGMSLRDWFAGQVLSGMHARDGYDPGQDTPEKRARLAYIDAEAMLAARAKDAQS